MEFNRMGVAELAAAISERRVSAYEATQACLEFLAQAGPLPRVSPPALR